jgi:hypothetical protein
MYPRRFPRSLAGLGPERRQPLWPAFFIRAGDVVFTSPVAVRIFGGDGVIRGKEALRRYWSEGIRLVPDLHFEVLAVYVGISTLVINYRNQAGGVVSEVLTFEGSLVKEGHGTYLA